MDEICTGVRVNHAPSVSFSEIVAGDQWAIEVGDSLLDFAKKERASIEKWLSESGRLETFYSWKESLTEEESKSYYLQSIFLDSAIRELKPDAPPEKLLLIADQAEGGAPLGPWEREAITTVFRSLAEVKLGSKVPVHRFLMTGSIPKTRAGRSIRKAEKVFEDIERRYSEGEPLTEVGAFQSSAEWFYMSVKSVRRHREDYEAFKQELLNGVVSGLPLQLVVWEMELTPEFMPPWFEWTEEERDELRKYQLFSWFLLTVFELTKTELCPHTKEFLGIT